MNYIPYLTPQEFIMQTVQLYNVYKTEEKVPNHRCKGNTLFSTELYWMLPNLISNNLTPHNPT